jgi:hypothetical protein
MSYEFAHLDYFELHALLINKNKEFTSGIKAGKNHSELQAIYTSIQEVYIELQNRKLQPIAISS